MSKTDPRSPAPAGSGNALLLGLYLGVLWLLLLAPYDFDTPRDMWLGVHEDLDRYEAQPARVVTDLVKSLAHALIFFPLGPLLGHYYRLEVRRLFSLRVLAAVVSLSVATELAQLAVNRGTSLSDFLMNLIGYGIGVWALHLHRSVPRIRRLTSAVVSDPALWLLVAVLALSLHGLLRPDDGPLLGLGGLRSWDSGFPLLIGDERTGGRAWSGTIERLEIRSSVAPDGDAEGAVYEFRSADPVPDAAGGVRRIRGRDGPVLVVDGPGIVAREGSIGLDGNGSLRSEGSSWRTLIEAIRDSGEFLLRARFRTESLEQYGPARIVSSSNDIYSRNFTLGQSGSALVLRLRTPLTGPNGSQPSLRVSGCLRPERTTEVRVTYHEGVIRLRIDGEVRRTLRTNVLTWLSMGFFEAPPARRVALGLGLVWWACCLVPIWRLLERRRVRFPTSALLAGVVSLVLLLGITLASL